MANMRHYTKTFRFHDELGEFLEEISSSVLLILYIHFNLTKYSSS